MAELTADEQAKARLYDEIFTGISSDRLAHDLFREAFGDEHPERIDVFSSWTRGTRSRALAGLRLSADGVLADLSCGLGDPGRWLARESGTYLVGVDISQAALAIASEAADRYLEPGVHQVLPAPAAVDALDGGLAHEPFHPLAVHLHAKAQPQFRGDPRRPVAAARISMHLPDQFQQLLISRRPC